MGKAKLLIIDDEADLCNVFKVILEQMGAYEVSFATDPATGIDQAKSIKPDLILLDISMPTMDGPEVAKRLSQDSQTKGIPIAFLTALAKESEIKESGGLIGKRLFISKAISPEELIQYIESILKNK